MLSVEKFGSAFILPPCFRPAQTQMGPERSDLVPIGHAEAGCRMTAHPSIGDGLQGDR